MWYQEDMLEGYDEDGNPIWKKDELLEFVNGEWVKVEGDVFGMVVVNIGDMIGYGEMSMEEYLYG